MSELAARPSPFLPRRAGASPRTTDFAPHSQLDQLPSPSGRRALCRALLERVGGLEHVVIGGSHRAPPGTVGLHVTPEHACGSDRAFLLGHEFAHVHVEDDGSLHAILPEPLRSEAIGAGWAEPHPLAGQPTVSPDTVMLYAPRDEAELAVIAALVRRSWENALGGKLESR